MRVDPDSVLDIGANVGQWTAAMRQLWPDASFHLVEANPGCYEELAHTGESFTITLLGASRRPAVPFYALSDTATGASVYRELTGLYDDVTPTLLQQNTLDELFPLRTFDFIKLDTQGSELDILRGGSNLVADAKWILIEVSTKPYNDGAPLLVEVITYMEEIGFPRRTYIASNPQIHQHDLLFSRENE